MLKCNSDIIYNDLNLVIVPMDYKEYFEALEYSFKNVVILNYDKGISEVLSFIKNNNFKQIILVDYVFEYESIISQLDSNKIIKILFTKALGAFSEEHNYFMFNKIVELYNQKRIKKIGVLDINIQKILIKKNINIEQVILDIPRGNKENKYNEKLIGILNDDNNTKHSFYNSLSALKFKNYVANLSNYNKETKKFLKLFNIKYVKTKNNISNNILNLYINFTDNNYLTFIKSMDEGIPCILGNNSFPFESKYLKDNLVLKSDDNINEIAAKINIVSKNRSKIVNEYEKERLKYSEKSKKSINNFLDIKISNAKVVEKELLLSIVVPVYNTSNYLSKCLKSILRALPKSLKTSSEILIINDGSTDNSEEIILKFQKKYPELIKYIGQKNKGLGNVRNVALKNIRGKYIASIDSDDTINKNFFLDAVDYMNDNIDIIMYNWLSMIENGNFETSAIEWCFNSIGKYEGLLYTTIMPSACNKIIKKELYDNLKIKYNEDKYEDLSTNPFIMLAAKTIKYINKPYYEYYIRSDSIMRSSAGTSMISVLNVVNERIEKYKNIINIDMDKFNYYVFSWRIEEFIMNQLYIIEYEKLEDFINNIYSIKNIIINTFNNKHYLNMLNSLENSEREYIMKRNVALKKGELSKYIKKVRKENNYFKLNAPIIYFGKNS